MGKTKEEEAEEQAMSDIQKELGKGGAYKVSKKYIATKKARELNKELKTK